MKGFKVSINPFALLGLVNVRVQKNKDKSLSHQSNQNGWICFLSY